ncbi:MAG TPA: SusC/RagA family TonB-linked outer membrane protein [Candidatus Odoribacter faecigallinarum]|uniref:SusC/RagA family TonB-linked outer membrane protein n=1 Tax=Candidatus Odoribacter faecigallinarum TaxID=2838706 RepID=A0A9D2ABB1_9BACT|nr:SusC/RagA family TonB-linked outer membrane protein [Candidatus Odoribacter faecigallinarum]
MTKFRFYVRKMPHNFEKILCKMRFTLLMVFICGFSAMASSQKVALQVQNATLKVALNQLKNQAGVRMLFDADKADKVACADCRLENVELREALDRLLEGTSWGYQEIDGVYVVRELPPMAQAVRVSGKVVDEDGQPLPGVSVVLKGTTTGVVTDVDGNFTLMLPDPEGAVLVFSFVGMKTQEIVYAGQQTLNIVMKQEISELEDVVVTGYQTIVREKVTGSTSTVTSRQLEERYTPNLLDNLEGRVAGLVTYGDKTLIRGSSSMYAETEPLLVVDGLPIEGSIEDLNPYDIESVTVLKDAAAAAIYGARASNGVIVVTTKKATKEGVTEIQFSGNLTIYEKKNMDYHDNFYMSPAEQVDVESAYYDYYFFRNRDVADPVGSFEQELTNGYSAISPLQYAYYRYAKHEIDEAELESIKTDLRKNNFAKEFGENALRRQYLQQYNLALRTRTDRFNSSLVLNYKRDNNGIVNSYDNAVNISYRMSYDVKKWLTASFNFNGILAKAKESASAYATDPFNMPAYYRLLNEDGSYNYYAAPGFNQYDTLDDENPALKPMDFNHLEELGYDSRITDRRNMRYQGELLFKIIDGLSVNTSFVYETERQNISNYSEADSYVMRFLRNVYTIQQGTAPNYTYEYMIPEQGGKLTTEDMRGEYWTWRGQLNFNRTFGKHSVDFLGGFEFRETKYKGTKGILLGYDDQLQSQSTTSVSFPDLYNYSYTSFWAVGYPARQWGYSDYIEPYLGLVPEELHHYASGYMNLTYTYDNRYNLFGSFRKDYADLFGANAKFRGKPLWSVGASWNLSNEYFLNEVKWLNSLKLRLSYGKTGNIYQGATSYMTASTGNINYYTQQPVATVDSPANPNLKWEKTATTNVGVDFSLLDHRLRGSFDYYYKKGTDIFSQRSLDVSKGFTSMNMNMADMKNNGVEITLSADWFRAANEGDFAWTTSWTAAYNKNEITYMEVQATRAYELVNSGFQIGYPTSALFSYRYAGLDQVGAIGTQDGLGQPLYWLPDGTTTGIDVSVASIASLVYSGQTDPKGNIAMDNTLRYKGFSLNFMMVYYGGHKMRVRQYAPMWGMGFGPLDDYYVDSWTPENTDTDVPGIGEWAYVRGFDGTYEDTDIFVQPADFIKIRNITLGYDVPKSFLQQIGMDNLRVTFQIDDLPALWKKNKVGVDPETLGIRNQMTYIVGLNFNF